jgi:hypothetical protein
MQGDTKDAGSGSTRSFGQVPPVPLARPFIPESSKRIQLFAIEPLPLYIAMLSLPDAYLLP